MPIDTSYIEYITNEINEFILDKKKVYKTINYGENENFNIYIEFRKSLRFFNRNYYECLDIVKISVYPEDQKIGQYIFDVILSMGYNLYVESITNNKLEHILRKKNFYYCGEPSPGFSNMIFINKKPKSIESTRLDIMKRSVNFNNFSEEESNDSIRKINC